MNYHSWSYPLFVCMGRVDVVFVQPDSEQACWLGVRVLGGDGLGFRVLGVDGSVISPNVHSVHYTPISLIQSIAVPSQLICIVHVIAVLSALYSLLPYPLSIHVSVLFV